MGTSLFEEEFTMYALSQMGNPLEMLSKLVDFEKPRTSLEDVLIKKDSKTPAGRPRIVVVLMFKVIFLQRYCSLGTISNHRPQQLPPVPRHLYCIRSAWRKDCMGVQEQTFRRRDI